MTNNDIKDKILMNVKENIAISNIKKEIASEKKENKNVIYSVISACAVILIVGIVSLNNGFGRTTESDINQSIADESILETETIQNVIKINSINRPELKTYQEIALLLDDYKKMSKEELENYYQTKIFPNYIPVELKINDAEHYGIYSRNDDIYYDQNNIIYENKNNNQGLYITVARERKINYDFDYRNDIEKTYNTSIINGIEIAIFNYEYEEYVDTMTNKVKYNCYYTNFEINDTCFDITSYNIEQEEFIKILSSLL